MKATLTPKVLRWARERAGLSAVELADKLGVKDSSAVEEWEQTGEIDFAKVEKIAHATHTPIGYLFLAHPPKDELPIKDFRQVGSGPPPPVSPDLLDVVYAAQRRQAWYRDYLVDLGQEPLSFVGKIKLNTHPEVAAAAVLKVFKIGPQLSRNADTWQQNLSLHIDAVEGKGVLVMRSGVVGNSNNRKLSVDDFRGFALCDEYAPVIFINSSDSLAAQIFTLVHELAHIFIGESAVSNLDHTYPGDQAVERFCNALAAEILMPMNEVKASWRTAADPIDQIRRLARLYKVSTLVAARRAHDADFISKSQFERFYKDEVMRLAPRQESDGGNFYNTMNARVSGRLAQALIASTLEGKTLYGEAMNLLGIRSSKVIQSLAQKFGYTE